MKPGYVQVDARAVYAGGKIRKMRCLCTQPALFKQLSDKNGKRIISFFNNGETGHPFDKCPVCQTYIWYTV